MPSELLDTVRRYVRRERLLTEREPVHIGVSGGIDSMVLLDVLRRLGHACSVIHVDHGIRGKESAADMAFVSDHCKALGIPFLSRCVDVPAHVEQGGSSVQMAARELRYAFFEEVRKLQPRPIALAHHADDAVETLFINLLRGAGVTGWAGIRPINGPYVRPLLAVHRSEIERYAAENAVPFREDASNTDPKYLRNRIRHELLPLLEDLRPGAAETIARSLAMLRELTRVPEAPATEDPGTIPFHVLEQSEAPGVLLHSILRPLGFHPDAIEKIRDAVAKRSTGRFFRAGDHQVVVDREALRLSVPRPELGSIVIDAGDIPGSSDGFAWEWVEGTEAKAPASMFEAVLDADRLRFPLILRSWQRRDRIRPIGLRGSKLVSDILIDAKVPRDEKHLTVVLVSGRELAWVVGYRIGEGFERTDATQRALRIRRI